MNEHLSNNFPIQEPAASANIAAEEMRRKYIKHEASVKSIGILYFAVALFLLAGGIAIATSPATEKITVAIRIVGVVLISLGGFQFWGAIGLRKLESWAKIPVGVFSGIGLFGFPIGTLINGYILYLVFSENGAMVFSPEYKNVITATPHIKYKTSIVVWIFLGILIALLAFIFINSLFSIVK